MQPVAHAAPPAPASTDLSLRRLCWRARRGLLENDIIIQRFLERHGALLLPFEIEALTELLELPDNELLDLLLSRTEPEGALDSEDVRALLKRLRAA